LKPSRRKAAERHTGAPFLRRVVSLPGEFDPGRYPFNIPAFSHGIDLALRTSVTFFVGENGSGRAESFYNFATYIDQVSNLRAYGGKSLHKQSHGESFLALFAHRFEQGIYILDEPEAALSPQRQLSFLRIIHDLAAPAQAQFLISTHSPIILSYPGAVLFSLDGDSIQEISYRETEHYLVTRDFLNAPERYFRHLFRGEGEPEDDA
jgi:predicted ATPase